MGRLVLLLTTTGRRTGTPHTIGLQYELIDGKYYVAAADGSRADWYRNLSRSPEVEVQVGSRKFKATADAVADPTRIHNFLEYRLHKHPIMIRLILRFDGQKGKIDQPALETYSQRIRLVVLTPTSS